MVTESQEDPLDATGHALDLLDDEPTPLRARLLGVHARALVHEGREAEAVAVASESLALAQKLNLPAVVADATVTLANLDDRAGDADQARAALERVVAEAGAAKDTLATMRGEYLLGHLHLERSELVEAQDAFHRAAAAADSAGRPWAPYGMDARVLEAVMAYQRGHFDDALRITDVSGQSPPPEPEALMTSVRMLVRAARGDRSALELLPSVRPSWDREGISALNSAAAAIDLYGDGGDIERAVSVHDDAVRTLARIWSPAFQAHVRLSALLLGQLATATGTAPAAQRPALVGRGPALVRAVDAVLRQVEARRRAFGAEGVAWVRRARAEDLRLRWAAGIDPPAEEDLVEAWEDTVSGFATMGHVFEEARARVRLGTVLRAAGRAAEARAHLDAARETARRLGARPLLAELGATTARPGPGEAQADTLTPRENEILALVAEGRSNAEIGRRLYISAKTVSVHVSNILAKLGATGRTEAAAIARRRGLLD
jgi:DNA-binding NarL/FixJ family response regulator